MEQVILHDRLAGGVICLDERAWRMLACADGTRDLEGIRLAAARRGAQASVEVLRDFLSQLHQVGLIESGPAELPAPVPTAGDPGATGVADAVGAVDDAIADILDRPLEPLPDYTFGCDGSGACCRRYGTIVFSQLEAARARAMAPELLDCGDRPAKMFMPERGVHSDGALAVTMIEGRCAFHLVEEDGCNGHCAIHAAADLDAKPIGCSTYPRTFTDDGEVVRVSTSVECVCVLNSIGRSDGESLVPEGARRRRDLHPAIYVRTLPERIGIGPDRDASRAELRVWSRAAVAALEADLPTPADRAAGLWSLASAIEADGLVAEAVAPAFTEPAPLVAAELRPWLSALAENARGLERCDAEWRGETDLARRATTWVARIAEELMTGTRLDTLLAAPCPEPEVESFYLRAMIFGYRQISSTPLADALRDVAVRLLVARILVDVVAVDERRDVIKEHPLPLVEAMMRGHGLADYVEKVAR